MKKWIACFLALCLGTTLLNGCTAAPAQAEQPASQTEFSSEPVRRGTVLESGALRVSMGETPNEITVTDLKNGGQYASFAGAEETETVKGVMRLNLQSLVTGSYYDLELKKETDFYTANPEVSAQCALSQDGQILRTVFTVKDGLSFAVELALREDALVIRIPRESICETDRLVFKRFRIAPNLLSAQAGQEGYFLLPDGCGALMNFGNGKKGTYDEPVYGVNRAFIYEAYAVSTETVHLPVYGMQRGGDTVLALVTSGAAAARIFAATNGNETVRNRAYAAFLLREEDTQYITTDAFQTVVEETLHLQSDLEVTYFFCEENGGYSAMAQRLQAYLLARGMQPSPAAQTAFLSIYGAVREKQKFLGIPLYEKAEQITSAQTAAEIIDCISDTGAAPLVRLAAWDENTVMGYAAGKLSPAGSKTELKKLLAQCAAQEVPVYLSVPLAQAQRSGKGVRLKRDAIRNLAGELSCQYEYYRASNSADEGRPIRYLLDCAVLPERAKTLLDSAGDWQLAGIAVEDIAGLSYANYHKACAASQDETAARFTETLELLHSGGGVLAETGYFYALPYVDFVFGAPDHSSGFEITDAEVPFYQMVLSGVKGYAGTPVNQAENRTLALLCALETGASLHYALAGETADLQGTELEQLYGGDWNLEKEQICKELRDYGAVLECVAGSAILRHEILADGLRRTHYANGITVTVNYGSESAVVDGNVIPAEGYLIERGDFR